MIVSDEHITCSSVAVQKYQEAREAQYSNEKHLRFSQDMMKMLSQLIPSIDCIIQCRSQLHNEILCISLHTVSWSTLSRPGPLVPKRLHHLWPQERHAM